MGTALSVPLVTTTRFPDPAPCLGRVELSPTSPDLGRPAHLAGEGPARTGSSAPGAWFVCFCTWQPPPTMLKGLGKRSTLRAPGPPASETGGCSLTCELHYPTGTVASSMALWCGEEVCPPPPPGLFLQCGAPGATGTTSVRCLSLSELCRASVLKTPGCPGRLGRHFNELFRTSAAAFS